MGPACGHLACTINPKNTKKLLHMHKRVRDGTVFFEEFPQFFCKMWAYRGNKQCLNFYESKYEIAVHFLGFCNSAVVVACRLKFEKS